MSVESKSISLNNNNLIIIEIENNQETNFEDLPPEMRTKIASYLDAKDIINLRLVSKSMHDLVEAHLEITWNALKNYPLHKDLQIKPFINGTERSWSRKKSQPNYLDGFKMLNSIDSHSEIFDYEGIPLEKRVLLTFNAFNHLSQIKNEKDLAEMHGDCMLWNQLTKGTNQPLVPEVNFNIIHSCLSNDYNYRDVHTALQENLHENNGNLKLSSLFIKTLSSKTANFQIIHSIDLSFNQLNMIPSCIFNLPTLTLLNLSHNKIKTIPNEISKLENLNDINLDSNQITIIPNEFSKLEKLNTINLNNNNIREMNNSITEIHKIKSVFLKLNPITVVGAKFQHSKTCEDYTSYRFSTKHATTLYEMQHTPYVYTYSKIYTDPVPDNKPIVNVSNPIQILKKNKNECVIS